MNSEHTNQTAHEAGNHSTLKTIVTLVILLGCWVLWFMLSGGWFAALLLSVVGCLSAEYLGFKIFRGRRWFERLSVEHTGFSIWRIVLGTLFVLLVAALFILGRALQGLGICVVGVGLMVGLMADSLKAELAYLLAGLLLFSAGQLCLRKFKG